MPFKALHLSDSVLRGVQAAGYTDPTPIQLRAVPVVLGGGDLIASAQTGTGKTAAFALPILTRLGTHGRVRVLVLEPTRELAAQVETAFRDFARFTDLRPVAIFGGVGYGHQRTELKRGVDITRHLCLWHATVNSDGSNTGLHNEHGQHRLMEPGPKRILRQPRFQHRLFR